MDTQINEKDFPPLKYDRRITISVGESRMSINWKRVETSLRDLWMRLKIPRRGQEKQAEYFAMDKTRQDKLKDVGGFVGGVIEGGRRKRENVRSRDLVTLDLDNIPAGLTEHVLWAVGSRGKSAAAYSTRKHRPEAPRLRILIPLDRTASPDEYEPIARWLAKKIGGIEWADPTTFEPSRLMYWPSCSADGEYVFQYWDGPLWSADEILQTYDDWQDFRSWPTVPGENKIRERGRKQADPDTKTGVVGAFCRCFDIYTAISTFLSDAYTPYDRDPNRYTYTGGTTSGGAIVYDNGKFLYSHHASDPCCIGHDVNSFDLVRLHKYGSLDEKAADDTPSNRLPSYTAMIEFAAGLPAVSEELARERYDEAVKAFSEALEKGEDPPVSYFHKISAKGVPSEILDARIEDYIIQKNQIITLEGQTYIYGGGVYALDEDGRKIKTLIRKYIVTELVTAYRIDRVYKLFLSDDRLALPDGEVNAYPARWINFQNGMLDVETGELHDHSPKYHSMNQIPHEYIPDAVFSGSTADRFLRGLIPDEQDRIMFLTFIGLCMTRDTSFQKFLILQGSAGIGKSVACNLVTAAIGPQNISSVPLQRLNERFQSLPLMHKLLNSSTDIPATSMDQTSVIRLITGEDRVPCEIKGGKSFSFENYAKLLFSANEIPAILSENPAAYFRRVLIIECQRGDHIGELNEGLRKSVPGFIAECVRRLRECYQKGAGLDSPNSRQLVDQYLSESDSVIGFVREMLIPDPTGRIPQHDLYNQYCTFCYGRQWKPKSNQRFYGSIRGMGYAARASNGKDCIYGLSYKPQNT